MINLSREGETPRHGDMVKRVLNSGAEIVSQYVEIEPEKEYKNFDDEEFISYLIDGVYLKCLAGMIDNVHVRALTNIILIKGRVNINNGITRKLVENLPLDVITEENKQKVLAYE